MHRGFGAALNEFGAAVDIADDNVLEDVNALLAEYLVGELKFHFYEILVERWVRGKDGPERALTTLRVHEGKEFPNVVVGDGSSTQTAYSFVKDLPLWITATDGRLLKNASAKYIDSWGSEPMRKLPKYRSGNGYKIRTSVIQPLRRNNEAFGVLNIESEEHLMCNQWAKHELGLVAEGVSAIVARSESHRITSRGTKDSVGRLGRFIGANRWKVLNKPRIFIACSEEERVRKDVVDAVKEVADTLVDHDVIFWQNRDEDGEARRQMVEGLSESRIIICYLSEPGQDGSYVDNPNVLFEAGVAEGLAKAWGDVKLVPIREKGSAIPWDLGGLNLLQVPRDGKGKLKKTEFKTRLRQRLV